MTEHIESSPVDTLLIDADDTLWENITVFYAINDRYAAWVAPDLDPVQIGLDLDQIQKSFVGEFGYGRETFEHSLIEGVRRFAEREPTKADMEQITEFVAPLKWAQLEPYEGVVETLEVLGRGARLLLVTKGNREEQTDKIERTGVGRYFDGIEILPEKVAKEYERIVGHYGVDLARSWMIGNSPRSDILPPLEVGLGAIYIPHSKTWSLEVAELPEHRRLLRCEQFTDLPGLLGL